MVRPDVIVTWPKHLDYPPFRLFLKLYWHYFKEIFIVFSEHNIGGWDFTLEVAQSLDNVSIMFAKGKKKDWRDDAVNQALKKSNADWVLFIEQDFFIKNEENLSYILEQAPDYDVVAAKQDSRWHPCFMLVRKSILGKKDLDFSADPNGKHDHFGKFTQRLIKKGARFISLTELGVLENRDYRHMNGLSYNLTQCILGKEHFYEPEQFMWYLENAATNIGVSEKWTALEKICKHAVSESIKSQENKKD